MHNLLKVKFGDENDGDRKLTGPNDFKYTKIVAWLLNRPKEQGRPERDHFFKKLNRSMEKSTSANKLPIENQNSITSPQHRNGSLYQYPT